jgi:Protein of unknown function (DUF1439)
MTKLRLTRIAALALGALTIAGAALSAFGPEQIALSEVQLQERMNRELPRQFHGVTIEGATVRLADGRISLRVEARATALGKMLMATAFARGVPRYNAEHGEVFFDAEEVQLEDFGSGGFAKQLGSRIEAAAASVIAIGTKAYLAARPVYRFKDDIRGLVLKAAIKDIAIVDDTLVINVSLIKLTTAVAGWLFGLTLAGFLAIWSWSWHARGHDRVPNSAK